MIPEEVLEATFCDKNIQQFDIYTQSTIIHAVERAIDECGFEVIKPDLVSEVSE